MEALPSPLSSQPERSAVEGSAVPSIPMTNVEWERHPPLCHPDRSEAQWRDLQFRGPLLEMFSRNRSSSRYFGPSSLPLATCQPIIGLALACGFRVRFCKYAPCRAFAPCVLLSKPHNAGLAVPRRLEPPSSHPCFGLQSPIPTTLAL